MTQEFYTRAEVADILGTTVAYLAQKETAKLIPFFKDGKTRRVFYDKKFIDEYKRQKLEKIKEKYSVEVLYE